ncbi:MAG TPA: MqnA/MqnD/SBP family protein [Terriglobales bacterium]|nr:MqnA/MqnD/SBP family protein [Terriglobales bacterium]
MTSSASARPWREIRVAHSPDSDDAFMFYALAQGKLDTGELRFTHVLGDIESLNRRALQGEFEITAVSFHAYPYLQDRYRLLNHGGSVGYGYGPLIVAPRPMTAEEAKSKVIAIAGERTTSALALKLFAPGVRTVTMPFDEIMAAVQAGRADAGLLIHEGQLTYAGAGLHKVVDLGAWWLEETGLPLPLGGNVIRRDLPPELAQRVSALLKASIQYGLEHRRDGLAYAQQFARDMPPELADRFVGMYVNQRTIGYGPEDKRAIEKLLTLGYERGIIPHRPLLDFLD